MRIISCIQLNIAILNLLTEYMNKEADERRPSSCVALKNDLKTATRGSSSFCNCKNTYVILN